MPTIDTPSKNLFPILSLMETVQLPIKLEPYRPIIEDEIRWCLHTLIILGRRQRSNTKPISFFMVAIDYLIIHKIIPYENIYEICTLNGMQSDHFWTAKLTFRKYVEKYKKKINTESHLF
jgi:hypothetical protein